MQHNILTGALAEVNTTEGNKTLAPSVLYQISDYDSSTALTTLSGSDIFVMEFDLGHRIHLDRFEYKFVDPSAADSAVASGIEFFYKDESFESYTSVTTYPTSSGVFYTTISGVTFAPRYLKMKHTLADTYGGATTSGNLYGFKAINNDTIVDFGTDSNKEQESIEVARGTIADVRAIPIYNSGTTLADALVNLEPAFTNLDEAMSISDSESGPWVKSLDSADEQLTSSNLDHGFHSNTQEDTGLIRIEGFNDINGEYVSAYTYGQYVSPVFNKAAGSSYCRVVVSKNINNGGHIVVDEGDPGETIEIRTHNTKPTDYAIIRELYQYYSGNYYYIDYRDRWLSTQAIKESSTNGFAYCSTIHEWTDYGVEFDQNTERWAGWCTYDGVSPNSYAELYLYNNLGVSSETFKLSRQNTARSYINFAIRELKLDNTGGMWIYFYCQSYYAADFVDATGYYFAYFDKEFNNTFKLYTAEEEIGIIDVNYDTQEVWYTRPDSSALYKATTDGTIVVNFSDSDYTSDLGALAILPSNNIIFGDGKNLHYLQSNGVIIEGSSIEDAASVSVDYIVLDGDGDEAVWIIDGLEVGRFFVAGQNKGAYDFKIDNIGFPIRLRSVDGGVWVKCTESEVTGNAVMKYISKENRKVDVTFTPENDSFPALIFQTYENINYKDRMPVSIDSNWSSLPWSKLATESYLLSEDDYYQVRLTLRIQTPYERYPTIVSDPTQEFINEDYFTQTSSTPNQLLWGNWTNKPAVDRVYVDTVEDQLTLITQPNVDDPFIDTSDRMTVALDDNGYAEVILSYKIGSGNGVESGNTENIYIYLESVDPGSAGLGAYVRLYIPSNPLAAYTYIYKGVIGGSFNNIALTQGTDKYEGEIRLLLDANSGRIYGNFRPTPGDSWVGGYYPYTIASLGTNFKVKFFADHEGSNTYLNYIYINQGISKYYTESPEVLGVYEQKLLEINDIYPNNSKNVYIKAYVPNNLDIEAEHDMDMKVRWRVASY